MDNNELSRRELLQNTAKVGGAMSLMGAMPSAFAAPPSFNAEEEKAKKAAAKHVMTFGSPYKSAAWEFTPHMHQEFKHHVQTLSGGKIYVEIKDGGSAGTGTKLMAKIARNSVNAGLVSASNLVPVAPALDILNIPFWSADNESYVNLVTSKIWDSVILEKIRGAGSIDVLFHYAVGPRSASTAKSYGKTVKTPDDSKGLRFRVPASKTLATFYKLAGATPRKIGWGKTAEAARKGLFDALDPGIIGLYNGPDNLRNEIHAISRIQSVHDGWLAVVSQKWLASLPADLREIVKQASDQTFRDQLKSTAAITAKCIASFEKSGATVYMPTAAEKQQWIDKCGHANADWTPIKKKLLGDISLFDKLAAATKVNNGYDAG